MGGRVMVTYSWCTPRYPHPSVQLSRCTASVGISVPRTLSRPRSRAGKIASTRLDRGPVALNRKIMDIAERNISTGFDLATRLAGAKNPVEAIEIQAAYWRKQFGELRMQAEEVRTLLERVTDSVAEPIKAQVT